MLARCSILGAFGTLILCGAALGQTASSIQGLDEGSSQASSQNSDGQVRVTTFGALSFEGIYSNKRLVSPSSYLYVSPDFGLSQNTTELSARATSLGFAVTGPQVADFHSGGLILLYAFGPEYFQNFYGITIFQGYGELKNEDWRFSFGLMQDLINPLMPTTLNWGLGGAAGNLGFIRAQARGERYFHLSEISMLTTQVALTNAIASEFATPVAGDRLSLGESNGWPNVEGRIALSLGELDKTAQPAPRRPFELGMSAMVGEVRTTTSDFLTPPVRETSSSWMTGLDARWNMTKRFGVQGEAFYGQALGSYLAGAAQGLNTDTFQPIRSVGGFGEAYYYWTPTLHSHAGYGIDDPIDSEVANTQRVRNQIIFGNLIWDATKNLQLGGELGNLSTGYKSPLLGDSSAWIVHTRIQLRF